MDMPAIARKHEIPTTLSVDKLIRYFRDALREISKGLDFDQLDTLIQGIEYKAFEADHQGIDVSEVEQYFNDEDFKKFNDAYCEWETELERIFVDSVMSGKAEGIEAYRLNDRFIRLLEREVSLVEEKTVRRALFIGSGPVPVSAIHLHKLVGAPVDCLEMNADSVVRSKKLLKHLGFDDIQVLHGNGGRFDASNYDLILVALLAKPKGDILQNLACSIRPDCAVVCRTSHGFRHFVYEPTYNEAYLEHFNLAAHRKGEDVGDTISSVLLDKKPAREVSGGQEPGPRRGRWDAIKDEVEFTWPTQFSEKEKQEIPALLNDILKRETQIGFPGVLSKEEGLAFVEDLERSVQEGSALAFNIQRKGRIVGMAILKRNKQPNCRHIVEISKGMVHPDHRGMGIMEAAFLTVAEKCISLGMEKIILDVRVGTRSEKIWTKLGFNTYGYMEDYAREDGKVFAGRYMDQPIVDLRDRLQAILKRYYMA